jgi:acetoin utilization deacetylase AcuC-like enzyme
LKKVGSRGTWSAAVSGVSAAIAATDMVVHGECVNAFCIVRPPGHHAGRTLHPMKAVSNGFCILNSVACAAIHATLPQSEGGLGLSRVCIIDFDAHHGNGTQDILCSTLDPRFLYVSLHAGGSEINGHPMDDDPDHELHDLVSHPKLSGIFPGRCGDTSPHDGVLNIPLGPRVTSHSVGVALISLVSPKVEAFSPDLIILSAGFDAHKNDPMGLGALKAEDFGHITQNACELAFSSCSGRVVSVLEGGYGVPCCRPQIDVFLPKDGTSTDKESYDVNKVNGTSKVDAVEQTATHKDDKSNRTTETGTATGTSTGNTSKTEVTASVNNDKSSKRPQPSKLLDLGDDLPESMDDQVPFALQARLEKCHSEGFVDCVFHHVQSLVQCNKLR